MRSEEEPLGLVAFGSALARLGDALAQPKTEWTRDAALQRFEFTVELAWKSIARFARLHDYQTALSGLLQRLQQFAEPPQPLST